MSTPSPGRLPRSLALVGAGKMGGALLEGWLAAGLQPECVIVIDPGRPSVPAGIRLNPAALEPVEVVVLGVKPQMLEAAGPGLAGLFDARTLLVSIIAGKTVSGLRAACPGASAVVRAMPNLPASIGRGATGAYASPDVTPEGRDIADALLSAVGLVAWVAAEETIDAVTAVSGSGPAYVFRLCESLARAGVEAGLPADLAERLARATVTGAAELLARSEAEPADLRRAVTSPGGTTAAALAVLDSTEAGIDLLLGKAVAAARRRAGELAG